MHHFIYKTINNLNGKYYIGRHSTSNLDDGYLGSGVGLMAAIGKYGSENFSREIVEWASDRDELWQLEEHIVNKNVVSDKNSYNQVIGGKSYLSALKKQDPAAFIQHQKNAGKKGAQAVYGKMNAEQKKEWHSKGGKASKQPGGYEMSEKGKRNISAARKKQVANKCPVCCNEKLFDWGNLTNHITKAHGWTKEDVWEWRSGSKVDN